MKKQFFNQADINISEFDRICSQTLEEKDYHYCSAIQKKVVIYEGDYLSSIIDSPNSVELKSELHNCLKEGPGIFIIKNIFTNKKAIDKATKIFLKIIAEENKSKEIQGDHFAKPGENKRLWNSFQKLCESDPEAFIDYYNNKFLRFASEAWLGPFFQMTSQVNIVKPGGVAQNPHRDYHLGFQEDSCVSKFPLSSQILSQFLTLQGSVAHTDMAISSGPTIVLPFSQKYSLGYMAWRNNDFKHFFRKQAIQIPMEKGDAMFLNPALFHAAGDNKDSKDRIANLLQVSSAFGKPLEAVDRFKLAKLIYPILLKKKKNHQLERIDTQTVCALAMDGYPFPSNLDLNPPLGNSTPTNMQALVEMALRENWPARQLEMTIKKSEKLRIA